MNDDRATWLTMDAAAAWIGPRRADRPTAPDTVRRWCLRGLRGVRLKSRMRGGVRMTRASWLRRFFVEAEGRRPVVATAPESPGEMRRRERRVTERLRRKGLL